MKTAISFFACFCLLQCRPAPQGAASEVMEGNKSENTDPYSKDLIVYKTPGDTQMVKAASEDDLAYTLIDRRLSKYPLLSSPYLVTCTRKRGGVDVTWSQKYNSYPEAYAAKREYEKRSATPCLLLDQHQLSMSSRYTNLLTYRFKSRTVGKKGQDELATVRPFENQEENELYVKADFEDESHFKPIPKRDSTSLFRLSCGVPSALFTSYVEASAAGRSYKNRANITCAVEKE